MDLVRGCSSRIGRNFASGVVVVQGGQL